jgi:hypothetical protein
MLDVPAKVISLFDDLIARGEEIKDTCKKMYFSGAKKGVDAQTFEAWRTSCLTLLRSTFGNSSPHCDSFNNTKLFDHYNSTLLYLGILQGAREDLRHGYFYHKDLMLSINVFSSFLSYAKLCVQKGESKKAAGIVESVVSESLRKLSEARNLPPSRAVEGLRGLADALLHEGVLTNEAREQIAALQEYLDGEVGESTLVLEGWLAWVQKFLYDFLGSRIVIVN